LIEICCLRNVSGNDAIVLPLLGNAVHLHLPRRPNCARKG
jgi:hypothetical protein